MEKVQKKDNNGSVNNKIKSTPNSIVSQLVSSTPLMLKKSNENQIAFAGADVVQKKENSTGLPNKLKSGIESLSGYSMDDVNVHYNSSQPTQFNAHAFAQGTDIHLGSGQEKHLPHEAWHVVQQKQGRVQATQQMKGKININDDENLEREADIMGEKALQIKQNLNQKHKEAKISNISQFRRHRIPNSTTLNELSDAGAANTLDQSQSQPLAISRVTNVVDIHNAGSWATRIEGYREYLQKGRETRTVSDSSIASNERLIGFLRDYQIVASEQTRTLSSFQQQSEQVRVDYSRIQAQFTHLQLSDFINADDSIRVQSEQLVAGHGFSSGEAAASRAHGGSVNTIRGDVEEAHSDAMNLGSAIGREQERVSASVYAFQSALNNLSAGIIPREEDPALIKEQRAVQGQINALKGHLSKGLTVISAVASGGTSALATSIRSTAGAEGTLMRKAVDYGIKSGGDMLSPDNIANSIATAVYDRELNSVRGKLARSNAFKNQAALLQLVNEAREKQRLMTSNINTFQEKLSQFESAKDRLRRVINRLGEEADHHSGGGRRGYRSYASLLGDTDALLIQVDMTKRLGNAEVSAGRQASSSREQIEGSRTNTEGMEYFIPTQHFQLGNWTPWGGRRYGGLVWKVKSSKVKFNKRRGRGSAYSGKKAVNLVTDETLVELDRVRNEANSIREVLSTALGVALGGGGGGSNTRSSIGINSNTRTHQ